MRAVVNHCGYTICEDHPRSKAKFGAFMGSESWFEGDSLDAVKTAIDEALDEE